jgi:predicted RNA-binding Zn-ribbon protein involved in translation (DUF1610 family)
MALHEFICTDCGIIVEDNDAMEIHKCPECDKNMRWNCQARIRGNYKHPIHSDSLAINPEQRAEHERLFPDIRLDKECRPIFDNYRDHEAYLKKTGFVKLPKKIKRVGKRIYP